MCGTFPVLAVLGSGVGVSAFVTTGLETVFFAGIAFFTGTSPSCFLIHLILWRTESTDLPISSAICVEEIGG